MLKQLAALFHQNPVVNEARWIVVDTESSGLDMHRDRLLSIAAIVVHMDIEGAGEERQVRIVLGDSFEVVLQQEGNEGVDKDNILLHGIGVGEQAAGLAPAQALRDFCDYVGESPLLAFHAAFDRTLIARHISMHLQSPLQNPWMDLEHLAQVILPQVKARSLDEWMAHFDIHCAVRHQAAADALATAEVLLKLWPSVLAQIKQPSFAKLSKLALQRRWLP